MSSKQKKILILSDVHVPYEDKQAFSAVVEFGKRFKPDTLIVLGDFFDFYAVSFYPKDPRRKSMLCDELSTARSRLNQLEKLGAKELWFFEGNHDARLQRYIHHNAPALQGLVDVDKILEREEHGWKVVPYGQHVRMGKIYYTHDAGPSGKSAIEATYARFHDNVVFGHSHRLGVKYFRNLLGDHHVAMNTGWLGSYEHIDYEKPVNTSDWSHGFGIGYVDTKGLTQLIPVPVVDGKIYV